MTGGGFYLACYKQPMRDGLVLWWGPDNCGYTTDLSQAGIYYEISPGYHDCDHTVPVPVELVESMRVRRVVDTGDCLNTFLWNAKTLRAELAKEGGK